MSAETLTPQGVSMSKKIIIGILVICLLAFIAFFAFAQNTPRNIDRWEYTTLVINNVDVFVERSNGLGREGWELVSTNFTSQSSLMIFKRKLP